jgi:arylsulfatase
MVAHWPAGFAARAETRSQFHHVTDIAPTILEAAGIPAPTFVNGIQQLPLHGVSMRYCFDDVEAPGRHETQYFEIVCNRGIYHKGWTAVTRHSIPWLAAETPALDDDTWELYDTTVDWSQAHDLAAEHPDKLRDLQRLFLIEAVKYGALPLDDRRVERFLAVIAGRPELITGRSQLLYGGMGRLSESSVINTKNTSHSVTADIEVPEGEPSGVCIAQGGAFGGWSLYLAEGRPTYCYNLFGITRTFVRGADKVAPGPHQLRAEFAYGGGLGGAADVTLFVDGEPVGDGHLERTTPLVYSYDETTDVGSDAGSTVSDEYDEATSRFPGVVNWVQIDVGADDADHVISADERWRVSMARQ